MGTKTNRNSATDPQKPPGTNPERSINTLFRDQPLLVNKPLSSSELEQIDRVIPTKEALLFVIVGDLNLKSEYATSFLAVTDHRIYGFDSSLEGGCKIREYAEVRRAFVKRYYGNAMLIFSADDSGKEYIDLSKKHENFIRFSYKTASLYDAAARYIENVAAGKDSKEELKFVEAAFEKQFCICPKCGRRLIRPGAPCLNCQSKGQIVKKLARYILPQKWLLLFCLLLSVITTAVSLIPPYMTKTLVDDVLPTGKREMLLVCVGILLGTYLIQYGIGAIRSYYL